LVGSGGRRPAARRNESVGAWVGERHGGTQE
jgi:hypothetical protein